MGILDSVESMMGGQSGSNPNGQVAGGLLGALEEHPGGLGGLMQHMQNNGVDTQAAASGQPMSPDQAGQGLQGSGMIENVAQRTGMSPEMVKIGLATVLPMVMAHMTQGGTHAAPNSGAGSMASEILGRFL